MDGERCLESARLVQWQGAAGDSGLLLLRLTSTDCTSPSVAMTARTAVGSALHSAAPRVVVVSSEIAGDGDGDVAGLEIKCRGGRLIRSERQGLGVGAVGAGAGKTQPAGLPQGHLASERQCQRPAEPQATRIASRLASEAQSFMARWMVLKNSCGGGGA